MNLLNRLTVKNLQLNKRRTTVTIIGIMLSAALITAVASMYVSGIKAMISLEKRLDGNFHAVFYHVPVSDLDRFENNRNIESYNLVKEIGYARIDSKNKDKPYACLKGFTEGSYDDLSVRIVSGRFPENDREIVIPTHLKTNGGLDYKVSDMITLELGRRVYNGGFELGQDDPYEGCGPEGHGESLTVTETKTYTIVGVIERPASTIENYAAPGYTFITYADHDEMTGKVDVYARFTKDAVKKSYETMANILGVDPALFQKVYDHEGYSDDELAELSKQMEDSYLIDINRSLIDMETGFISTSSVGGLGIVAGIVIGVIVAASVFCIKNSFDISITEKIKQYGMLRSIGATKKQIRNNVFYEAGILGLIGIPLGILLGYLASYLLVIFSNYYLYFFTGLRDAGFKLEYSFSAIAALIAATLGIVTVYFSAFRSARKASKVSPIDSIRNSADIRINPKKIRSPKIINRVFGIGGEISYKSLKRNRRQYRTTMISIIVSVFVFITLSGFMGSAIREVESELKISDYNISLIANTVNQDSYHRFLETVHFDGVEDYSIVRDSQLSFTGNYYSKEYADFYDLNPGPDTRENIFIICVGKDQYQKYIRSLGLNPADIKDKAILLDKEMQADYDENNDIVQKYMRKFDFNKGISSLRRSLLQEKMYRLKSAKSQT